MNRWVNMTKNSGTYMLDVAEQMSLVGVFLGAISISVLVTLIVFNSSRKPANWIVTISALSACSLLISVVASLRLMIALHPDFPSPTTTSQAEIKLLWNSMVLGYGIGVLGLAVCVGLSGWLRSRRVGMMTLSFSLVTVLFFVSTSVFS